MTVGELIEELKNLPPHLVVWTLDDTGTIWPAQDIDVVNDTVFLR